MTRPVAYPLNAEPVNRTISEGSMLVVLAAAAGPPDRARP